MKQVIWRLYNCCWTTALLLMMPDQSSALLCISHLKKVTSLSFPFLLADCEGNILFHQWWEGVSVGNNNNKFLFLLGHLEIVKYLVANKANVHIIFHNEYTPLNVASSKGWYFYSSYENDMNLVSHIREYIWMIVHYLFLLIPPFWFSYETGHLTIVQFLLNNGALIDDAGPKQSTPLYAASQKGNISIFLGWVRE